MMSISTPGSSEAATIMQVEQLLNARWGETAIAPSLDRITTLMDLLGNPQRAYPVIQIAGTNGKTSTARMIDSLLTAMGLRVGRFTSPHLQWVTERISVDGEPISDERYVATYRDIAPYIDMVDQGSAASGGPALSKFEVLTAMAFAAFADTPVDVAVIEVGIGGTWDCTNIADADIAVICSIGLDHMDYLGPDIASIASNKAGIIKQGATVIIGEQQPEAMRVVVQRAVEMDATVARFNSEFSITADALAVGGHQLVLQGLSAQFADIFLPLHGAHQAHNAAVALAAVEAFRGAGATNPLPADIVAEGFSVVTSPGRLERVRISPRIFIDAAHNPHGARALAATIADEFSFTRLVGVLAIMADKDVRGIMTALVDVFDEVVVTVNSSPRSMPVRDLADIARDVFGEGKVHTAPRMDDAITRGIDLAESDPDNGAGAALLITGSVVSAGDGRALAGLAPQ